MRLTGEGPRDEAAAHAGIARRAEFLIDPLLIAVAETDDAEAARVGHRLRQRSTGRSSHRGKKDRMADAELLGELCAKGHRTFYSWFAARCRRSAIISSTTRSYSWGRREAAPERLAAARAVSGHAATAPPRSVMNLRRFMSDMVPHTIRSGYRRGNSSCQSLFYRRLSARKGLRATST